MRFLLFLLSIFLIAGIGISLSGCMSQTALKAPCDAYGTGCGPKIKINQWNCS